MMQRKGTQFSSGSSMFSRRTPTSVGSLLLQIPSCLPPGPILGLRLPRFSRKVVYLNSEWLLAYFFLSPLNLLADFISHRERKHFHHVMWSILGHSRQICEQLKQLKPLTSCPCHWFSLLHPPPTPGRQMQFKALLPKEPTTELSPEHPG